MTPSRGRPLGSLELPSDPLAFARECARRGWSDGLPVVPPTSDRVQAMLRGTARDPLEVVAVLPPRQGEATVEAIAASAVMAGCEPRQFPIVVAAIEGLSAEAFNLDGINATTHPCGVFVLVSGPAARRAAIHGGAGCFGPGFPANLAVGRAIRLVLLAVAGATPGKGDRATQGTPAKLAFCAAEREDASPWAPFHTTRGLEPGQAAVTVFACEGPHNIQDHGSNTGLGVLQTIAGAMGQAGSNNILGRGEPILALGPEHAATIAADGFSRQDVQQYVFEHARFPADRLSAEFVGMVRERIEADGNATVEAALLPIADNPAEIHVIVAGGPGKHSAWMPTFGGMTRPVTVPLPG